MADLRDYVTCPRHYSSVDFFADQIWTILLDPLLSSVYVFPFNVFAKKLLFVKTFVKHMCPIIYLPILFKYCFHFAHLHHLERPRHGVAGRNFAIVFARTDEHAAFYTWLDIPIRPDQKIVVVPAAV